MNYQKGQVLLITVMLLASVLTIVMAVTFTSRTETQIAKLEEDSKRALAAAEAGIEAALRQGTGTVPIGSGQLSNLTGFTGQAVVSATLSNTFTTPLLMKDQQYTFYLSLYDPATEQITGGPFSGQMRFALTQPSGSYCGNSSTRLALELTFLNKNGTTAKRLIDECSIVSGSAANQWSLNSNVNPPQAHILIVRLLSSNSSFAGATLQIINRSGSWPAQGKTITSEARYQTGVTKKVQLFQSYPQFPAEMFVTSY